MERACESLKFLAWPGNGACFCWFLCFASLRFPGCLGVWSGFATSARFTVSSKQPSGLAAMFRLLASLCVALAFGAAEKTGKGGRGDEADWYTYAKDIAGLAQEGGEKLQKLWDSGKEKHIIEPCEKWVAEQGVASKRERIQAVSKAKSSFCNWNALSGFIAGALPPIADLASGSAAGFYLQAQGACVVAKLRGHDVRDNVTQSMIVASLLGEGFSEAMKAVSGKLAAKGSEKAGKVALKRLPNEVLKNINKQLWPLLGRRLLTKGGAKGLLSLGKLVPLVGSAVGAAAGSTIDLYFCHEAIDYADKYVFNEVIKEQERLREGLREVLEENDFEDLVEVLVQKGGLDLESICEAETKDLTDLGVQLGRVIKLRKLLSRADGPCPSSNEEL